MLGAQSLKDLVPEMVCPRLLLWTCTEIRTEFLFVMQVEKVEWQSLSAKL